MIRQWRNLTLAFLFLWPVPTLAEPRPPCGASPLPRYSEVGSPPNVETWTNDNLAPEWTPPTCTGWTSTGARVLVALAGSFHHSGSVDDLLSRFGAVSTLRNIHYWSVTDKTWDTLITDASALAGPDAGLRRPDFTAAEMKEGDQYLVQYDNRSSNGVIYRMRVLESGSGRLVIDMENLSRIRVLLLTLFNPGDLQSVYFLDRLSPQVWGYYSLSRVGTSASALSGSHIASYVNRSVALYRHAIGVPTDQDPPFAP
jgi:hypothetical protein